MKFSLLLLLAALATVSMVKAVEDEPVEVDAEVVEDDEAEVEIEDDEEITVGDDEDVFNDEAEMPEEDATEQQAMLMPTPAPGFKCFIHFVEGAHSITGGKMSEVVIGVQNNGDKDYEIAHATGRINYPNQLNEVVQNFTTLGYDDQVVPSKQEASLYYAFIPNMQSGGREFNVALELFYKEANTKTYYRAVPFNETVNILESTEGVATEKAFMYLTLVVLLVVGGFYVWNRYLQKLLTPKPTKSKVERGTANEGVDLEWIPKSSTDCTTDVRKRK